MAYYVQTHLTQGTTQWVAWFDCDDVTKGFTEDGWNIKKIYRDTILKDAKGADGNELRTITDDTKAREYKKKLYFDPQR